ncbi:hypothetical protein F5882DRAFT_385385 [Hyaloscypha sp. PMI_1271]|nr:hypothetical protein F5882DRAFT_385385 [Hyaloscypha sp. PMI_1271]
MRSLFLKLFLSVLAASYTASSASSGQYPLAPLHVDLANPETKFPGYSVRCGDPLSWRCRYISQLLCRCLLAPPELSKAKTRPGTGDQVERDDAASLEVVTEIQPGNNATLVSLFELQCEENSFVGCVYRGVGGFVCGCHEDVLYASRQAVEMLSALHLEYQED